MKKQLFKVILVKMYSKNMQKNIEDNTHAEV